MCLADRPLVEASAAGVDIGAREIYVAVPPDRDEEPVRVFTSFTEGLTQLADWLIQCGIMVTRQVEYDDSIWASLNANREARFQARLKRQAERRGFVLVPKDSLAMLQTGCCSSEDRGWKTNSIGRYAILLVVRRRKLDTDHC
jgi:hypothetical protein